MPFEITTQNLPMSENSDQTSAAQQEGSEMDTPPERRLPMELFIAVADQLSDHRDITALGLTCTDLYIILVKKPRRSLEVRVEKSDSDGTMMTAPKYRLLGQQAATLTFAYHGSIRCPVDNHQQGGGTSCNCWGPVNSLHAINQHWKTNRYKELTLSGHIPEPTFRKTHPLISTSAFMAIEPETFKVDLDWRLWDYSILERMFVVNLKSLKLPLSHASNCVRLGRALTKMPRLVRLAITNVPNCPNVVNQLGHIGEGILNCASTLRELDIEMDLSHCLTGNEPGEDGFIFNKLFPCRLMEEISKLRKYSRKDRGSVVEVLLRLTKLRFKYLNLPRYSFGRVLDPTTIKHIHLPCSMADDEVWEALETHAQLETLTEIDYWMLSAAFLRFLRRQSLLKELIFVCQQYRYLFGQAISFCHGFGTLVPDIGHGYPSQEDFLSSLQHMKILEHLVLPRDMYPITDRSLTSLAATLTGLEHLEIGFDYEDHRLHQAFASHILCGMPCLKRITFLPWEQFPPITVLDNAVFQTFIGSLGSKVSANLRLLRYIPQSHVHDGLRNKNIFYHRKTPLDSEWWLRVPADEGEQIFAEGCTPRVVPVGKWDWEIEAQHNRLEVVGRE